MNLILFGFKGSGKSYFGKLLAKKQHRPFLDTDELISQSDEKKRPVRQIYQDLGEKGFRSLEKKAIQSLQNTKNAIIALGGGAVLDPENVDFLQNIGTLVYLKLSPGSIKKRILEKELPPFIDPKDPEKAILEMIHEREPIYRSIPARVIDTESLDTPGVLAALTSILLFEDSPNGF